MQISNGDILVLDAMGVLYESGDDVAELLVPFIAEHGGLGDASQVEALYLEASLGQRSAASFWRAAGISPDLEDDYLARHRLNGGVMGLLAWASDRFHAVYCLSNDVSEWSRKLRRRFGLEDAISGWFVSGDLGCRKPSAEIYRHMIGVLGVSPRRLVFVDDRPKNLDAAAALGLRTVGVVTGGVHTSHPQVTALSDIPGLLATAAAP